MKYSNGILLAGNVLVLPVLWKLFRRDEKQGLHKRDGSGKFSFFWVVLLAVCGCVGFNGLIALSPLPVWFPQGQEVLNTLYGGNKWIALDVYKRQTLVSPWHSIILLIFTSCGALAASSSLFFLSQYLLDELECLFLLKSQIIHFFQK